MCSREEKKKDRNMGDNAVKEDEILDLNVVEDEDDDNNNGEESEMSTKEGEGNDGNSSGDNEDVNNPATNTYEESNNSDANEQDIEERGTAYEAATIGNVDVDVEDDSLKRAGEEIEGHSKKQPIIDLTGM